MDPSELGGGRYRVIGVLGHGGMGTVYHCQDTREGREVAVKELIPPSGRAAAERIAQFADEAQLLASLTHPHLPRVFDSFQEDERHYLVMERVRGMTMRQWVEAHGRAPQALAIRWLDRMLDVLGFLHANAVIFRDVSPDNVMVDGPDIKLIDFGLARLLIPEARTRPTLRGWGSPNFAAPEHYTESGTDVATDVYGVAATAYWLFVGEPPPEAVQRLIANEHRLEPLERAVRKPLHEWVRRGMALEPGRRFESAEAMRMALMHAAFADTPAPAEGAGPAVWAVFLDALRKRLVGSDWTPEARPPEPFSLVVSRRVDLRLHHAFCWPSDPLDEDAIHQAAVLARQHALKRKSLLPSILFFAPVGTRVRNPEAVAAAARDSSNPSAGLRSLILVPVDLQRGLALDLHVPPRCRNTNDPGDFILNLRIAAGGGIASL